MQDSWRNDPKRSGKASCMGNIGTQAFHLSELVSGLKTLRLMSDLSTLLPGRLLDDDANIYRNAATCIQHILEGTEPPEEAKDCS